MAIFNQSILNRYTLDNGYTHTILFLSVIKALQLFVQVVVAIAEILSDQLKSRLRNASGSTPKIHQLFTSRSMDDIFSFLNGLNEEDKDCFVCVVIHNIDGPGLRDSETQEYLARVASCSYVRIIASIDHVNAPLCEYMFFISLIFIEVISITPMSNFYCSLWR